MFHRSGISGAMALEDTVNSHDMYLVEQCSPSFLETCEGMGDVPIYSWSDNGETPTNITSPAITAVEARLHSTETLTGFLRISSQLVGQLLAVTSEAA